MVTVTDIRNSEAFVFTLDDNRVITASPVFNPDTQVWDFPDVPQDVADALADVTGTAKFKLIMNGSVPGSLFDSTDHAGIDHSGIDGIGDATHATPVQTIQNLRDIAVASRVDKQLRLVEDAGIIYRFDTTGVGADDGDTIIVPTVGSGRWFIAGVVGSDDVVNDSGVAGVTVSDALNTLDAAGSDDITNDSGVVGVTVSAALDTLDAAGGGFKLNKTAFVSFTDGNDGTAAVGDSKNAFKTVPAAVAAAGISRVSVMPGTYPMTTLVVPAGVIVEAIGGKKHEVEFDFTSAAAEAISLGIGAQLIGIRISGFTITGGTAFWGNFTDNCEVRGCRFDIFDDCRVWTNPGNTACIDAVFDDNLFIAAEGGAVGLTIIEINSGTRKSENFTFTNNVVKLDSGAATTTFEPRVFDFTGGEGIIGITYRNNRVINIDSGALTVMDVATCEGELIFHQNEFSGTGTFTAARFLSVIDARVVFTNNIAVSTGIDGNDFVEIPLARNMAAIINDNNVKGFDRLLLCTLGTTGSVDSVSVQNNALEDCGQICSVAGSGTNPLNSLSVCGNNFIAEAGINLVTINPQIAVRSAIISKNIFRYPGVFSGITVFCDAGMLNVSIIDNVVHAEDTFSRFLLIAAATVDPESIVVQNNKLFLTTYQAAAQFATITECNGLTIQNNETKNVGKCLDIGTITGGTLAIEHNKFYECGVASTVAAIDVADFTAAELFILEGNTLTTTVASRKAITLNGAGAPRGVIRNNTIRFTGATSNGIEGTLLGASLLDYQSSGNLVDVTGTAYNYSANVNAVNDAS